MKSKRQLRPNTGRKPTSHPRPAQQPHQAPQRQLPPEGEHSQAMRVEFAQAWKRRLQETIFERRTNPRRVSISAGLNPATLRNILMTTRSAGIETITAICEVLEISIDWLVWGESKAGRLRATDDGVQAGDSGVQIVPVLSWASVPAFVAKQVVNPIREERAEMITPADGRFRLDVRGTSMAGIINDGDIIDCSTAMRVEPEDIVVAWSAQSRQVLARRIIPNEYDTEGRVVSGTLKATRQEWPDIQFDASKGDRILAVVFDVIRPLRRDVRGRP